MNRQLKVISRGKYKLPEDFDRTTAEFYMLCYHPADLGRVGGLILAENTDYTFDGSSVIVPYLVRSGLANDIVVMHWMPHLHTVDQQEVNSMFKNFIQPIDVSKEYKHGKKEENANITA